MGGTVRDLILGLDPHDIDLVIAGDPVAPARRFADAIGGGFFVASEEFLTCRVISSEKDLNYDFSALRGSNIFEDLAERDFTVNAMAVELPGDASRIQTGGASRQQPGAGNAADARLIDPFGGGAHLAGRELVPVNDRIFERDPLRLLRAVRLEKTHGLIIGPGLAGLIGSGAPLAVRPAGERSFAELSRLLEPPGAAMAIRRLDRLGLLQVILPEVTALEGIVQNEYHHLDVYGHTLAFIEALESIAADPERFFPGRGLRIGERLDRRIAGDADCRLVLILAGLFHDIAKPFCRFTDNDGLVRFFEHDRRGSDMAVDILSRFRVSSAATDAVAHLVRRHMRFEGLLQEEEPSERARLRYLRATEPFSPEAIILSVADRLSVRGVLVTEADIASHLEIARGMMERAFAREDAEPLPKLIDGEVLMRELALTPGPFLGSILDHIREEQHLGNISSSQQALAEARRLVEARRQADAQKPAGPESSGP
ncbi:MAG: HD domain-containing protein [Thermoleophilia bacterium]